MKPWVEAMKSMPGLLPGHRAFAIGWFLTDRDDRFREGNDKVWGAGNWVRCATCLDSLGYPAYHHKDHHAER